MRASTRFLAALVCWGCSGSVLAAGVALPAQPVVLHAPAQDASFQIQNPSNQALSVELAIHPLDAASARDGLPLIYPPRATLPPQSSQTIRLRAKQPPPSAGYRAFRIAVKSLSEDPGAPGLSLNLGTTIMFWHFGPEARGQAALTPRTEHGRCEVRVDNTGQGILRIKAFQDAAGLGHALRRDIFPGRSLDIPPPRDQTGCLRAIATDDGIIHLPESRHHQG